MKVLTGKPGVEPAEDLSNDEVDAQLILEYLEAKMRGGGTDYGPPESAWLNGKKAHENRDAWKLLEGKLPNHMTELGAMKIIKRFNPHHVPRGPHGGEFTHGPGVKLPNKPVKVGGGPGVKMSTKAIEDALAAGHNVKVSQSDIAGLIRDMGPPPPPPALNLGHLEVEGSPNTFTRHAREIPRSNMPQLPGTTGELTAFTDALTKEGVSFSLEHPDPRIMHMTQNQLDSQKVAKLAQLMYEKGWKPDSVLFASKDWDILDGHHRWAGASVAAMMGAKNVQPTVLKANTDIDNLLRIAETVSGPHKEAPRAYARAKGGSMKFGEKPTSPPPDKNKPYVWIGGRWLLVVTDTEDGVPASLDYLKGA